MWNSLCVAIGALVAAIAPTAAPPSPTVVPDLLHQTVSIGGTTAEVVVGPDSQRDGYRLDVLFRVPEGAPIGAGCISPNRDFRYELRDSHGTLVPVNQHALDTPPYGESTDVWSVNASNQNSPCTDRSPGVVKRITILAPLYPRLAPGTYTLLITFAPRGQSQEAAFAPVSINVDAHHPL